VFTAAAAMTLIGAAASLLAGGRPAPVEQPYDAETAEGVELLVERDPGSERPAVDTQRPGHRPARVTEVRTSEQ
jgi:hypothetical protein